MHRFKPTKCKQTLRRNVNQRLNYKIIQINETQYTTSKLANFIQNKACTKIANSSIENELLLFNGRKMYYISSCWMAKINHAECFKNIATL